MSHNLRYIDLFLDWKATAYPLRPRLPSTGSWASDPTIAAGVIANLSLHIRKLLPESHDWIVDVRAYGGFVDTAGNATIEATTLRTALAASTWTSRPEPHIRQRDFLLVDSLLLDGALPVIALARPQKSIEHAFLRMPNACNCSWRNLTESWLAQSGTRTCPSCGTAFPAILCHPRQKLVDSLMCSQVVATAHTLATSGRVDTEIWVCSTDADFVPPLAQVANWGIRSVWLQPRGNRKYGYADTLEGFGVHVAAIV
jgi:hypothetical protein